MKHLIFIDQDYDVYWVGDLAVKDHLVDFAKKVAGNVYPSVQRLVAISDQPAIDADETIKFKLEDVRRWIKKEELRIKRSLADAEGDLRAAEPRKELLTKIVGEGEGKPAELTPEEQQILDLETVPIIEDLVGRRYKIEKKFQIIHNGRSIAKSRVAYAKKKLKELEEFKNKYKEYV